MSLTFVVLFSLSTSCMEEAHDPPHYGVFTGVMLAGEASGRVSHGAAFDMQKDPELGAAMQKLPATQQQFLGNAMTGLAPLMSAMMVQNAFYTRPFFIGPEVAQQADYVDGSAPPFCMVFSWPSTQMSPALDMKDAGQVELTLSGNKEIKATDAACLGAAESQQKGLMTLIDALRKGQTPPAPQAPAGPGVCRQTWGLLAPVLSTSQAKTLGLQGVDVAALPQRSICKRQPHVDAALAKQGFQQYACPFDPIIGLGPASAAKSGGVAITDSTRLEVKAGGGANIAAFTEGGISPLEQLKPASGFDLNQIDPSAAVTATWSPRNADLVMVEIFAQVLPQKTLPDPLTIIRLLMAQTTAEQQTLQKQLGVRPQPKELGQLLCLVPAHSGAKAIPTAALAALPKPAKGSTDVQMLMTTVMGLKMRQEELGWGSYLTGLGRGSFGISCRTSAGTECETMKTGLLKMLASMSAP